MRFTLLEHDHPEGRHWDLLLEPPEGELLWCWALDGPPVTSRPIAARRLNDHRPKYLDYEGPISDARGKVHRWDTGTYELLDRNDRQWVLRLAGDQTVGRAVLRRLDADHWEFLLTTTAG